MARRLQHRRGHASSRSSARGSRRSIALQGAARAAEEVLYGGDDSARDRVAAASREIERALRTDPTLEPVARQLGEIETLIDDAADQLRSYADKLEGDPERLAWLDERLALIRRLTRKHGGTLDEVIAKAERAARRARDADRAATRRLAEVAAARTAAEAAAIAAAAALTRPQEAPRAGSRRKSAPRSPSSAWPPPSCRSSIEPRPLGPTGADRIELMLASNKGEDTRPLAKIASGGELSRIMLALKLALRRADEVATYVFDEVDTGIGGATAQVVGAQIRARRRPPPGPVRHPPAADRRVRRSPLPRREDRGRAAAPRPTCAGSPAPRARTSSRACSAVTRRRGRRRTPPSCSRRPRASSRRRRSRPPARRPTPRSPGGGWWCARAGRAERVNRQDRQGKGRRFARQVRTGRACREGEPPRSPRSPRKGSAVRAAGAHGQGAFQGMGPSDPASTACHPCSRSDVTHVPGLHTRGRARGPRPFLRARSALLRLGDLGDLGGSSLGHMLRSCVRLACGPLPREACGSTLVALAVRLSSEQSDAISGRTTRVAEHAARDHFSGREAHS